jgi:type I restriction enzyme, S subunit
MTKVEEYLKSGCKLSSLGLLPVDWEVKKLGSLVEIVSGVSPSLFVLNVEGKYPYLKVEDLNNCEKYQIKSREYSNDKKNLVPVNSVIFPKRGAAISNNKVRINSVIVQMDSNLMAIYPKSDQLNYEYLYYQITFKQLHKIADTSTIPQINNKHIIPYDFPLPQLSEQKAIAQLLGLMDLAINTNNQLIAKKELQKKWLMHFLLTGEKRLVGFDGVWEKYRLGDFLKEREIRSEISNEFEILTSSRNGLLYQRDYFNKQIASADNAGYKVVLKGDFTYRSMSDDNTFVFNQLDFADKGLISPAYSVFYANGINDKYLKYLLNEHSFRRYINKEVQGGTRAVFRFSSLMDVELRIPLAEEQMSITNVLLIADKEIQLLKAKIERLREQKRGLMQVLLTGKTRLKINYEQ